MRSMFRTSKRYMPTYILIAANVAVYAFTSFLSQSALETSDGVILAYGQDNAAVMSGEIWRFATAMFVHASILHIFGNMFFLLIFGLRAEDMFDLKEYLAIYFASGLLGGLLSLMLGPSSVSVGASGAIFGVLGASTIYVRRAVGRSIISALMYAFLLFLINLGPNVNFLAHLGGLVTGLAIGYWLAMTRKPDAARTYQYSYNYST